RPNIFVSLPPAAVMGSGRFGHAHHTVFVFLFPGIYSRFFSEDYSSGWNSSLPTPQIGHTQSSGISSNAVPGSIPLSGSPISGSYTYPHGSQTYFFIVFFSFLLKYFYQSDFTRLSALIIADNLTDYNVRSFLRFAVCNSSALLNRYMQNPFKIAFGDGILHS